MSGLLRYLINNVSWPTEEDKRMKVIANISLVPIGVGVSVSKYVAVCERVFKEAGLSFHLHANGTNVEGEWDDVFGAIKRC